MAHISHLGGEYTLDRETLGCPISRGFCEKWGFGLIAHVKPPTPKIGLRWSSNPQSIRHGDLSGQCRSASVAQAVVLSAWHMVQGFGILYLSVIAGVMKAKVCALTFTSAIVVSIFGMWQATQLLPADPFL